MNTPSLLARVRAKLRVVSGQLRRLVWKPRFPRRIDGRVLIHLGCGPIVSEGFINADLLLAPHIHIRTPLDRLACFATRSADLVYASHCLEHFGHLQTQSVLAEWVRILRPGGILRLAVPDFRVIAEAYSSGVPLPDLQGYAMGAQDRPLNTHFALFDENTLRMRMQEAGLIDIRHWDPRAVTDHNFTDDSSHCIRIQGKTVLLSLNLEGTRP